MRIRAAAPPRSACLAPSAHLYLSPNGDVRVCCRNPVPLGNVADRSFAEIWRTSRRPAMVADLAAGTFPEGCDSCAYEVAVEGPLAAFPVVYDRFAPLIAERGRKGLLEWPARIEFNLSNTCNLMCIQCDGSLSSMIRRHRERLPPLPKAYDDRFFTDLEAFIPHLEEVQFAGGEPFLAPENFRVWDLIERLNPLLPCTVVTNATQWNSRIERVGRTLQMGYTFSIDGMSAATYEHVRVNADFSRVMANVPRYLEMARAKGATVEVNFCLMRQNRHEFGELLLWAESLGVKANAQVVRHPEHCSLASLPPDELRAVVAELDRQEDAVLPHLEINRSTWIAELARLRSWADASDDLREKMWFAIPPDQEPEPELQVTSVGMQVVGGGPTGEADARRRLAAWAGGADLQEFAVDFDIGRAEDHVISEVGPSVPALLGLPVDALVGLPMSAMTDAVTAHLGGVTDNEVLYEDGERTESEMTFERARIRSIVLAERNEAGRLTGARVIVALRPSEAAVPGTPGPADR
jgi:MoaA/NifB/PqqE/SkfB family radical SAM enzyme